MCSIIQQFNQFIGNNFGDLVGFMMHSSPNATYYYVLEWSNMVYILNDQWSFISYKMFTGLYNMISIGKSLYITGSYNAWKVDQD